MLSDQPTQLVELARVGLQPLPVLGQDLAVFAEVPLRHQIVEHAEVAQVLVGNASTVQNVLQRQLGKALLETLRPPPDVDQHRDAGFLQRHEERVELLALVPERPHPRRRPHLAQNQPP